MKEEFSVDYYDANSTVQTYNTSDLEDAQEMAEVLRDQYEIVIIFVREVSEWEEV